MSPKPDLTALRDEIDALDDAILDLFERRLALSARIAAAKSGAGGLLHIRPRREAAVLARLRDRARAMDRRVVEAVWRELIGEGRQAQAPLELVLSATGDRAMLEAQARRHFGATAPIRWAEDPAAALRRARDEEAVAVLAEPPEALDGCLTLFDLLRDAEGLVVGYAIGRVAPDEAVEPGFS